MKIVEVLFELMKISSEFYVIIGPYITTSLFNRIEFEQITVRQSGLWHEVFESSFSMLTAATKKTAALPLLIMSLLTVSNGKEGNAISRKLMRQ